MGPDRWPVRLVEGIDRAWLAAQADRDPIAHAYATWDLQEEPTRSRVVSLCRDGDTVGYLVVWYGSPLAPIVHWVSQDPDDAGLADGLPERPLSVVCPERVASLVAARRDADPPLPVELLVGPTAPPPRPEPPVRRLGLADRDELLGFISRFPGRLTDGYRAVSLDRQPVWGGFEGKRLVGIARASLTLPRIWMLSGIFTAPEHRNRGWGRALTAEATRAALEAGATSALFVRQDNEVARGVYHRLGYRYRETRVWLDAGVEPPP